MKENKNNRILIDRLLFPLMLIAYGVMIFYDFHLQTLGGKDTDMAAYIEEMLGTNEKYPFPYPLYFKLGALIHVFVKDPALCMVLGVTILAILTAAVLKWCLTGKEKEKGLWYTLLTLALLTVSMLYVPTGFRFPGIKFAYAGVFTPNPLQNATYNAARPFAIFSFFWFARILKSYEKESNIRDFVVFSLSLFLTTLTKPSFTFVLVPTAGLIMLYRLVMARGKNIIPSIKLGVTFIPTFGLLLYQFFGVFGPVEEGERGIGFGFLKVWEQYCGNVPLAIVLAGAFPLFFLCLHVADMKRQGKEKYGIFFFALQCYLMSLVQFMFLYEKGFRMADANFSWGYMYGLFFMYVAAAKILLEETLEKKSKLWLLVLQWGLFLGHFICGICYYLGYMGGKGYY